MTELLEFLIRALVEDPDAGRRRGARGGRRPGLRDHRRRGRPRPGDRQGRPGRERDPHGRQGRRGADRPPRDRRHPRLTAGARRDEARHLHPLPGGLRVVLSPAPGSERARGGTSCGCFELPRHDAAGGRAGRRLALRGRRRDGAAGRRRRRGAAGRLPHGERPRIVLLSPTGRLLDDALADELAAGAAPGAALRPLRGLRRAGPRAPRRRRGLDRPLRARRRRAGRRWSSPTW